MTVFLYGEVNIPPIPESLITPEIINSFVEQKKTDSGFGRLHEKNNRILKNASYVKKFIDHMELDTWLADHVPFCTRGDKGIEKALQISQPGNTTDTDTTHIVHTDQIRKYALNYFLNLGGDSVLTNFYREKNKTIVRGAKTLGQMTDTGFVEYNNLDTLASVKFDLNKWYLISTHVLHDVDHIQWPRISVSISYNISPIQHYKHKNLFKSLVEI